MSTPQQRELDERFTKALRVMNAIQEDLDALEDLIPNGPAQSCLERAWGRPFPDVLPGILHARMRYLREVVNAGRNLNLRESTKPPAPPTVVIEVQGGVATCTSRPGNVVVEIIDRDKA